MNRTQESIANQSGKLEILLFSLGSEEVFGINVFKIREVTEMMPITKVPGQSPETMGMISLRGVVLPVINLAQAVNMDTGCSPSKLIIAEFASQTVAFAVCSVDKIVRVDWSEVKPPQHHDMEQGQIFGIILLGQSRLVSLLDIESICQAILPMEDTSPITSFDIKPQAPVFFVDDSKVARRQITNVLDSMGLEHTHAVNGDEAQRKLQGLVGGSDGRVTDKVSLLLVDEEMPGMDGCSLTRLLRADPHFRNVPIVMYSSLTSDENERRGLEAGVDVYVKKFDSEKLSNAIGRLLEGAPA